MVLERLVPVIAPDMPVNELEDWQKYAQIIIHESNKS